MITNQERMVLSNKKFADVIRIISCYCEEERNRELCIQAVKDVLQSEVDQYNKGLAKLNETNRLKREERRMRELRQRVEEYEQRRAMAGELGCETPDEMN